MFTFTSFDHSMITTPAWSDLAVALITIWLTWACSTLGMYQGAYRAARVRERAQQLANQVAIGWGFIWGGVALCLSIIAWQLLN